jgi:hypothetical protein
VPLVAVPSKLLGVMMVFSVVFVQGDPVIGSPLEELATNAP